MIPNILNRAHEKNICVDVEYRIDAGEGFLHKCKIMIDEILTERGDDDYR